MMGALIHGGDVKSREQAVSRMFLSGLSKSSVLRLKRKPGSIGIADVRALHADLIFKKEKTVVVLIEQAESLTIPAQNALLTLLEEPPEKTLFLLTTANANALLPTVCSRLREISLPTTREMKAHETTPILEPLLEAKEVTLPSLGEDWARTLPIIIPALLQQLRDELFNRVAQDRPTEPIDRAIRRVLEAEQEWRIHVNPLLSATTLILDLRRILQENPFVKP